MNLISSLSKDVFIIRMGSPTRYCCNLSCCGSYRSSEGVSTILCWKALLDKLYFRPWNLLWISNSMFDFRKCRIFHHNFSLHLSVKVSFEYIH